MTRAADTRLGLLAVQTMEEARDEGPINWLVRSAGRTFGAFGVIALFMATIGLYGVKAYLVACRTREIGIRTALGATPREVIRMIVGEGAMLLAISVVAGFLLAVALGRLIAACWSE